MTPPDLAQRIVEHFAPKGTVLDPCRGEGSFYNALIMAPGIDVLDWCELVEGRDFLTHEGNYDFIISNPPWSKMRPFLQHAMAISDNIVFIATMQHFTTRARYRDIHAAGFGLREFLVCPWNAAGGGFLTGACHLQRGYTGILTMSGLP